MPNKNKASWDKGAAAYSALVHDEKTLGRIVENPACAFHRGTWGLIHRYLPDLRGKRICVPSSGDNHAVFAFALLGAAVCSCDISENQLANARRVAKAYGWADAIDFICADTMRLEGVPQGAFDFVYCSNGVHVWIDDLPAMYRAVHRVLKPSGVYLMHEIHPFQRPFDGDARIIKPYDATGPFESETEVTFGWRVMDILNALADSGLAFLRMEEMFAEKDYAWPFFLSLQDKLRGVAVAPETVDRMYDWRHNPMAALPSWLDLAARKGGPG